MRIVLFLMISFLSSTLLFALQPISSKIVSKEQYKVYRKHKGKVTHKKGEYTIISLFSNDNEIEWAKMFDMVEMGGVDDMNIKKNTLKNKQLLSINRRIGYNWMPAFYYYTKSKNRDFVDWVYNNRQRTTLNPNGPFLHCKKNGYDWCRDYYYNYGDKELFKKRVEDLIYDMRSKGFNALFFDWASGSFLLSKEYAKMRKNFQKLNPNKNYFELIGNFYKTLKNNGVFIVTNQAFRKEKYLLKYVNYDMTESYTTTDTTKKIKIQIAGVGWRDSIKTTNYYPIYKNSKTIKDSLHFMDILDSYKKKYKKYGFKNFIYMNYIAPRYKRVYESFPLYKEVKPKNAIYYSYATAKLSNNLVYAEIPENRALERDEIYFYDLGKPLGKKYKKLDAINAYVRFFSNGFVLSSEAYSKTKYIKIDSRYIPANRYIYDAYDNVWMKSNNHSLVIKISYIKDEFTKKSLPAGRVFLYQKD